MNTEFCDGQLESLLEEIMETEVFSLISEEVIEAEILNLSNDELLKYVNDADIGETRMKLVKSADLGKLLFGDGLPEADLAMPATMDVPEFPRIVPRHMVRGARMVCQPSWHSQTLLPSQPTPVPADQEIAINNQPNNKQHAMKRSAVAVFVGGAAFMGSIFCIILVSHFLTPLGKPRSTALMAISPNGKSDDANKVRIFINEEKLRKETFILEPLSKDKERTGPKKSDRLPQVAVSSETTLADKDNSRAVATSSDNLPSGNQILVRKGYALMLDGKIANARMLFRFAAAKGDIEAIWAMAMSYDPQFVEVIPNKKQSADPGLARYWYDLYNGKEQDSVRSIKLGALENAPDDAAVR